MMRLAIITTHPIQYYAPVFKLLHQRENISIKVFYTSGQAETNKYDPGFGKEISWDIPLLDGYPYEWVNNISAEPGSHHYKGIINPDLVPLIQQWQADAVLVFGWAYNSHLKAIRYFKNKLPVYFRGDSTLLDNPTGIKALKKYVFLKWVYSHIDHAFYVGTNNKAYFLKYGLKEKQLSFAPHAIDNERFAADHTAKALQLRQKLGVGANDILILFAGKLTPKKSPLLLLNVFLHLKEHNIHLLFAGNGELEQELKAKAENTPNIHFVDFQNQTEMPAVYQACDLFCLPSKGPGETWGLAINEAMACGKAVLASDKVGCAIDLVKEDNGAIFKSEDAGSLLNCLKELISSKSRLKEMGKQSGAMIKEWNFTKIAEAIETKLTNEAV